MNSLARERAVLKPSQLNALARDLLEGSFSQVWVEGEISNYSRPASGHLYFTLKDDRAQVRCALFKQKAMYLRFAPRDGLQVLARGRLTLYEARGDYQLVLEHMEEAGEGALRRAFDALKDKLAAEGLFASERKRPLPRLLRRLAVITSPRGAAVRDVTSVLARRFPLLEVDVLPVPVQGADAAPQIRAMLGKAAASGRYDGILLTRGGGSLEDLWCFNDEALVRAIAECPIPIVSAVGHEVDFTLCDFAADLRAATPSAAAELLVPDGVELAQHLRQQRRHLDQAMQRAKTALAQRSDQAFLRLQSSRPQHRLAQARSQAQHLRAMLDASLLRKLNQSVLRLRTAAEALERGHPRLGLAARRHAVALRKQRLQATILARLQRHAMGLQGLARSLNAVSPFATLERGYAIIQHPVTGAVIRHASEVKTGDALRATLANGTLELLVAASPQEKR